MRICVIPARGGSRRVPRKNVRLFHGKPMLSYPIRTAQASGLFDLIVVSTDDTEIAGVAFECGATAVPRAFDDGTTGTQEIAARVLDELQADPKGSVCVVYPTSPLLRTEDLRDAMAVFNFGNRHFLRSVGADGADAGCLYWGTTAAFRARLPLEGNCSDWMLPAACDVNTWDDWHRCETMYEALRRAQ